MITTYSTCFVCAF